METGLDRVRSVWGSYPGVKSSDQSHKFNENLQEQELICEAACEQEHQHTPAQPLAVGQVPFWGYRLQVIQTVP